MPIYEYRCEACGHQKEMLQKMADATLTTCPSCGKESFNKLLSAPGFQLTGSGWYATDFKGSSKPAAKTEGGDRGGSSTTGSGSSSTAGSGGASAAGSCGTSCACH